MDEGEFPEPLVGVSEKKPNFEANKVQEELPVGTSNAAEETEGKAGKIKLQCNVYQQKDELRTSRERE